MKRVLWDDSRGRERRNERGRVIRGRGRRKRRERSERRLRRRKKRERRRERERERERGRGTTKEKRGNILHLSHCFICLVKHVTITLSIPSQSLVIFLANDVIRFEIEIPLSFVRIQK